MSSTTFSPQSYPNTAVFGLAVMGSNLARNIASRGIPVTVYNRTAEVTKQFVTSFPEANFTAAYSIDELIQKTAAPRRIILMIKAGNALDGVLDQLLPRLTAGDVIIDGGNTLYTDTNRRVARCWEQQIDFLGVGISGGEEGALHGPSLMPGGRKEGWQLCAELFSKIAAVVDGQPCTDYIGPEGSGHFVKMIHNGIEYADMQLIAEVYHFMSTTQRMSNQQIAASFENWNNGRLASYLIEITAKILVQRDDLADGFLVDQILDQAGQKGTGRWTVQEGLELGIPIPTIAAAVDARAMSSFKAERIQAAEQFSATKSVINILASSSIFNDQDEALRAIEQTLFCGKIVAYAQGMALIKATSDKYGWGLQLDRIAALWRGGCIIRAALLSEIMSAYRSDPTLDNLILFPALRKQLADGLVGFRSVVAAAALAGVPLPGFSSALNYLEAYTCRDLPQNIIQGQRDYFGAHTYQRKDRAGVFHTQWS